MSSPGLREFSLFCVTNSHKNLAFKKLCVSQLFLASLESSLSCRDSGLFWSSGASPPPAGEIARELQD